MSTCANVNPYSTIKKTEAMLWTKLLNPQIQRHLTNVQPMLRTLSCLEQTSNSDVQTKRRLAYSRLTSTLRLLRFDISKRRLLFLIHKARWEAIILYHLPSFSGRFTNNAFSSLGLWTDTERPYRDAVCTRSHRRANGNDRAHQKRCGSSMSWTNARRTP